MPRTGRDAPPSPPGLRFRNFPLVMHGLNRNRSNSPDVFTENEQAGPQQLSLPDREMVDIQASENDLAGAQRPSELTTATGGDETVFGLDDDGEDGTGGTGGISRRSGRAPPDGMEEDGPIATTMWNVEDDAANEERRRVAIRHELERSQRSNFMHFVLLCLVPTSLLLIVVASVLGEDDDCSGYPTSCANEPRSFINAFTTRCICDAIVAAP